MQDPIYQQIEGRPRPSIFASGALLLIAATGLWLASLISPLLPGAAGDRIGWVDLVYYVPFVIVPALLYLRRRRALIECLRPAPLPLFSGLLVVLLALLFVYIASYVTALWQELMILIGVRYATSAPVPENGRELVMSVITMAALPAVCEELLFRGIALSAWEGRGTRRAILVTAAIFAALHANVMGLPALLLIGAVCAYLVVALDSLFAGIVFHTVYNAGCLVIPYLALQQRSALDAVQASAGISWLQVASQLLSFSLMAFLILATIELRRRAAGIRLIPRIPKPLSGRERWIMAVLGVVLAGGLAFTFVAVNLNGGLR